MKIAITDANIFIDLIYIELQHELFVADLEIHTTFDVYDELNANQQEILSLYLDQKLLSLHVNDIDRVPASILQNKRLSPSDKSVFGLALALDAFILTGDGVLWKASNIQKIEVHGILWLLDRFIAMNLLSENIAATCLQNLMKYNKRLPSKDCNERLVKWCQVK